MDPKFYKKVFEDEDDLTDEGLAEYEASLINPSDLDIPASTTADVYAMVLDAPINVGRVVQNIYLHGKRLAQEEDKDTWTAMPYTANPALIDYLREVNWFYGVVMIIQPPPGGQYVGITTKGLELLVETFPSNSYKQRKQVKKHGNV